MKELELTPEIKAWLETAPQERDIMAGATLLLRVSRNRILYNNITRNPGKYAEALEYHLRKIYGQRLREVTHKEVETMMGSVSAISQTRGLEAGSSSRSEWQRGKRADHEELPAEIQKLYTDNADIMRRMRDAHTRLRMISPETSTCPDSDRYGIAKYLIELDERYRENWNKYDHYKKGTPTDTLTTGADGRTLSKNAAKLCTMLLGKYAKSQDAGLGERIKEAYGKVANPSDNLRKKMEESGLLG